MRVETERKIGILLQYLQMGISIIIQLVYTPIMLRLLSTAEYGIYNLAVSTISYLSLLSLGFGASYFRYYSLSRSSNDNIGRLNGLYLLVFFLFGLLSLIFGLIISIHSDIFFNDTYTPQDIQLARRLMLILTVNISWSFPASIFSSYVTVQEKFVFQKILNLGRTILGPVSNIILLLSGFRSFEMVCATTMLNVLVDSINIYYCFKYLKIKFLFSNLKFGLIKDIFCFSIFIAINQIVDQINWQTDKVILGKYVNAASVAVYTVGANINGFFTGFSTAISSVFVPRVNMLVSSKSKDINSQLTELFIKVGRFQWFVLSLIATGFVFFGKAFVIMWTDVSYVKAYYIALLLMIPAIIPLIQNIGIEIQRAKNMHQFRSIIYLFMAVINVFISIILAKVWHEIGAAIGTTISLVLANGIVMNIFYHKKIGINVLKFWKEIIATLKGYIIPLIFGTLLNNFVDINNLFELLECIIIYTLAFASSLYYLSLNTEEKNIIKSFMKRERQ